jgi:putative DNA primase/helicase
VTIDVDALKQSIDLVSLVGHFTPLKKRGAEYVGLCVAHNDHDPSMWVQPQKGFVHCFSCGFSADAISFVQHVEGLDFKAACERLGAKPQWTPIAPVAQKTKVVPKPERITSKPPPEQATPSMSTRELGEPQMIFPLRDLDGAVLGYECRYAVENGKKEIRMWTWGARGDAEPSWGCGHFNAPRPLYGLERLAERPEAPVSIFEGPKKAEAGKRLLPPYACISWTGGANAWHKHDWKPLAGRKVLLWPDADEAGWTACDKLAALLTDPRGLACSVRIVDTNRMPEGWDVADAEAEGWDTLKLIEWAKPRAKDYAPAIAKAAPPEPPEEPKARKPKLAVVGNTALAPEEDAEPLPAAMSDDALADAFAEEYAEDWRHVAAWGRWYEWTGDRWREDDTNKHRHVARMVTRQAVYWKDAQTMTPDGKRKINSARTAGAVLQLAQTDRRIAAKVDQWDTDPWLLGVPGAVVDLKTGQTLKPVREQYITAQCAVTPATGQPAKWLEFLQRVTAGDDSLIDFLHRCAGYWLTGSAREHSLTFLYGTGANGKSVFMRTLGGILGVESTQYAASCQMTVFTESKMERHSTELARLRGARLVIAEETAGGAKWDQAKIQWLTGEGSVTARFMRQDDFTFKPQFKLLFAGNHKPMLRSVDEAIKRRFHLVPFTVTIPAEERDHQLYEKLREEWPQILAWMIEGCAKWQKYALSPPSCVIEATENYLETEDALGQWVDECCDRIEGASDSADLWRSYSQWCEKNGEHAWSRRSWANALVERGFAARKGAKGRRMIDGISPRVGANLP